MRGLVIVAVMLLVAVRPVTAQTSAPAAPALAALTDESLEKLLTSMGYEPKKLNQGFLILIVEGEWKIYVQVRLSNDGTKLGLNSNLGMVEDESAVTAAQWKALLISNEDIEPSVFYYDAKKKKLYLHRSLDNRGVTAPILRRQIENFKTHVHSTEDLWKFTK